MPKSNAVHDVDDVKTSTSTVGFRVTAEERVLLEAVALESGQSLSELCRESVFAVAREVIGRHDRDDLRRRVAEHRAERAARPASRL
jgi:uncharacterized protein (DUF1778 family)